MTGTNAFQCQTTEQLLTYTLRCYILIADLLDFVELKLSIYHDRSQNKSILSRILSGILLNQVQIEPFS